MSSVVVTQDLTKNLESNDTNSAMLILPEPWGLLQAQSLAYTVTLPSYSLFEPYVQISRLRCLCLCWLLSGRSCDQVIET